MTRRRWVAVVLAAVAMAAAGGIAVAFMLSRPTDPIGVVTAWTAARNRGDVDTAMSYLGSSGNVFGIALHEPDQRQELASILAAQTAAGWSLDDRDCEVSGDTVRCRYVQRDLILDRWGLALTGRHRYIVRDGSLAFAERVHDPESRDAAYAAFERFRTWVEEAHPELVGVIWSDPAAALYSTPEGARAVLELLDEYTP